MLELAFVAVFSVVLGGVVFVLTLPKGQGLVGFLRRIGVARGGVVADATILSVSSEAVYTGGRRVQREDHRDYTIIYEVRPQGQPAFRARGIESLDPTQAEANPLREGATVQVRCDARRAVVVLLRNPSETQPQRLAREQRAKEASEREKQERLLRGGHR